MGVLRLERVEELAFQRFRVLAHIRDVRLPVFRKTESGLLRLHRYGLPGLETIGRAVVVGPEHQVEGFGDQPEFVEDIFYFRTLENGRTDRLIDRPGTRFAKTGGPAPDGSVREGQGDLGRRNERSSIIRDTV